MQLLAEKNAGCSTGFECLLSHWLTWRGGRSYKSTDGRTDGRKSRHNQTKISHIDALPKFVTHGAPRALRY